jgi:RNA polymerase sigma-70 factor (ECF subfamily)
MSSSVQRTNPSIDDIALMKCVAAHDESALARLYDRYSPAVYALCVKILGDKMIAEELTLDVFWELWERAERFDETRGSPLAYLLGVTRTRAIDRLRAMRARKRTHEANVRLDDQPEATPAASLATPLDDLLLLEQRARVRGALAQLPPTDREALELAYYQALSHAEISARCNTPLGTIKSRVRNALQRLGNLLANSEADST